jgi:hypothetical protein
VGIEHTGGPAIEFTPGRTDHADERYWAAMKARPAYTQPYPYRYPYPYYPCPYYPYPYAKPNPTRTPTPEQDNPAAREKPAQYGRLPAAEKYCCPHLQGELGQNQDSEGRVLGWEGLCSHVRNEVRARSP